MSKARINLDWNEMYRLALDPVKAKKYRESIPTKDEKTCSMCGNLCSMKRSKRVLEEEMV